MANALVSHSGRQPLTAADRVSDAIRALITRGQLAPGTRLVQRKLAARFGTSSIPVIEAIRRLEREGLVTSHPNWGAAVAEWSEEDIEGVFLMREALEGVACRLFASRAGDLDRTILKEHARRFDQCTRARDAAGCAQADLDLHTHIVRSARSLSFARAAEQSAAIAVTIQNTTWLRVPCEQRIGPVGVHKPLLAALFSGDPDAAERAGRQHVRAGYETLRRMRSQQRLADETARENGTQP